jgi:hypothetical protein
MSKRKKIWLVVLVAVGLIVLIPLSLRWQAQSQLSAYRKKLISSGERLTVAEIAPKRLQVTNNGRFFRLVSKLPSLWDCRPTAMLSIKPGVARVAWQQARCVETLDYANPPTNYRPADVWPAFADAARTNEQTLNELRTLVHAGGMVFIEDYNQTNLHEGEFLNAERELVTDLNARALLALHEARPQEALPYLKSCGEVIQLHAQGPLLIVQFVRYPCLSICAGGCWEALQAGSWSDDQLAELQRQWDKLDIMGDAVVCFEMERARAPMLFQMARSSRQEMADISEGFSGIRPMPEVWTDFWLDSRKGLKEIFTSYPRYWAWRWIGSYREEQQFLEARQSLIEAARSAQKRRSTVVIPAFPATNFMLLQPNDPFAQRFVGQAARAQTMANIVTAAIALERFRLAHHAYPAALGNLAPEFVQAVPVDYMDGHDLRYRLNPDGTYLLYSVGQDGVDNGGDPTPRMGGKPSFFGGRDWVWPRPATAQEMQAYEDQENKLSQSKSTLR